MKYADDLVLLAKEEMVLLPYGNILKWWLMVTFLLVIY
jgi:hypothetical protein